MLETYTMEMKNILVIDRAENCVYDIFSATPEEFRKIFPIGQDVAFIDEVVKRAGITVTNAIFPAIYKRRILKADVNGIHGTLFYELPEKKKYYPTRRDEEAMNPNGSALRVIGLSQ